MIAIQILAAHMLGDFVLQTDQQAMNKFTCWRARAAHVTTYCVPFIIIALLHADNIIRALAFMALLWSSQSSTCDVGRSRAPRSGFR